ncbi:MAG: ABC transporter permease [Alphaproteobacteria bacterium]|nr:ABC transporter permease [Alphaproteobacteria bacterium]MBQ7042688.1 ABC transporter permease [Muribaculaceae bacterium]
MKQFLSFIRKEFIHISRDFRSMLILLIVPQLMVIILGYIIKNDVEDIRVAVIDPSHDVYSTRITERLSANKYFIFRDELQTEAEALDLFRKGEIDLVIVFCGEFANRLVHTQDATIQLLSNGSEPNQASVSVAYAQQVISSFQQELSSNRGGMNIQVNNQMLFNPQQRSDVNFVPGIVGVIMLLICCMMTSAAIVRERETGTMEILLASPLSPLIVVMAKLVPYMVISLFNICTILLLAIFMMHIPIAGSLWLYMFVAFIYILTALMMGLFLSTCVNTQLAAMLISLLTLLPGVYFSDMVFALDSMPASIRSISNIIPAKWFIAASRKILIQGVDIQYVYKEIVILIVQGLAFLLLSLKMYKTRLE